MSTATVTTNYGTITIALNRDKAPSTVDNFVGYAQAGHYDNTIFHRVIPNFMIQGGGFTPEMSQKPTGPAIQNEARNGLQNNRLTVAMARTSDPHSATAQFFVNTADNGFLNHTAPTPSGWGYTVFGEVIDGADVVEKIAAVPTGNNGPLQDVPVQPVIIESVRIS